MEFLIRDSKGIIYNKVNQPAAIVDKGLGIFIKIGEYEDMKKAYDIITSRYIEVDLAEEMNNLALIALPKDQKELDKIFQITGYIQKYINDFLASV